MNDPIKIIWKYKNNNSRIQYHTYIFIGKVSNQIMSILNKISDLSFYDSLIKLNKDEYLQLESYYGSSWYNLFFNKYHVNFTIYNIRDTIVLKEEILQKYGKEWYTTHVESRMLMEKKIIYSYQSLIKYELESKNKKKAKETGIDVEDDFLDYTTTKKFDVSALFGEKKLKRESILVDSDLKIESDSDVDSEDEYSNQKGGFNSNEEINISGNILNQHGGYDDDHNGDDKEDEEIYEDKEEMDNEEETDEKKDEDVDVDVDPNEMSEDEELDLNEIEQIYKDSDVKHDDNISKTSTLIKEALMDESIINKLNKNIVEFDSTKDTNIYDENIKDIYKKTYITSQYIFKDDTIKNIKDKICITIKNNNKFGENSYLLPSRQYLWSEYYFNEKLEKIMIGQKWLRKNEILTIDIEPNNNIRKYEELTDNLKLLRDNLKRYTSRIRREDDDNNILYDYEGYIVNNELYMLDIYNELGLNYKKESEVLKNLQDVYLKLYFPKIRSDEFKNIIDYINNTPDKKIEASKMSNVYDTIINDLIIENEIMSLVEDTKKVKSYKKGFKSTHIIQSIIHLKLRREDESSIDLYRIFNEFIVNDAYPFILYQTIDGSVVYKFYEKELTNIMKKPENTELLRKWFENTPYGITIKFKISDKFGERFMGITINESGRLEYKIVWKEEDMAIVDDINNTYKYVKELIKKINLEKSRHKFITPDDSEFKYAFINTVQQFELPEKFVINHNDLSEFSRFFYPYIALVIEPRKRQSKSGKDDEYSKFGTYLRYKRVSKYDNQVRIEQRILYFLRNYEISDSTLINEISRQFNITQEIAEEELNKVKHRYPNLKKYRKILKKLENIPKYKSPGIGIDIQGKQREKYKIRISGARDKEQLDRIIDFMNILIHLYIETYLFKKPERQELKQKLKKLSNIAKRRNKVMDIVNYEEEIKTVKQMAKLDKQRIGYKPQEGQNQWTRCCQNSGETKKRRPQQYNPTNMTELLKKGYKFNKKTGEYERRVMVKGSSKGKKEVTLKTLKFSDFDKDGNPTGNEIYYACDPEENGEHFYVGFLTKCRNPFGHCMPCCFKKDPAETKNKNKIKFFESCRGNKSKEDEKEKGESTSLELLYILQDTNKIQNGRLGLLPKYLDFYFNTMLNKDKYIRQHYLSKTKNGYFFKYGSTQTEYQFLNAFGSCVNMSVEEIKNKIIQILEKDHTEQLYTSLNKGDIKTQFGSKDNFIDFIKNNSQLDYDLLNNILSLPNVINKFGLNIILLTKKAIVISKTFEKERVREDFDVLCENIEDYYSLINPDKDNAFIIKDGKNYYPIVLVEKEDADEKNIKISKVFKYKNDQNNIVKHISDFYEKNCKGSFMDSIIYRESLPTAKEVLFILNEIKDKKYFIKYQVIDSRNKCKFFVTENNTLIPTRPSGSIYNIQIVKTIDKYIGTFKNTYDNLNELYKQTNKKLDIEPYGVYYEETDKKDIFNIIGIITKTKEVIPIIPEQIQKSELDKLNLIYENTPLVDKIDNDIIKRKINFKADDRVIGVNTDNYYIESYELFRLELSNYINKSENLSLKSRIERIISNKKYTFVDKVNNIRLILYRLVDKKLYEKYKKITEEKNIIVDVDTNIEVDDDAAIDTEQKGGKYDKLLHISGKEPNIDTYIVNNDREACMIHKNQQECNNNPHCHWTRTGCYMSITKNMIIKYINKISEELADNNVKAFEILKIEDYYVSDIVDYQKFTQRQGQKVLRSTGSNVKKALGDIFGTENIPIIGKRKQKNLIETNYQQLNADFPLINIKEYYLQKIIPQNLTIFRAYVNGFYWVKNKLNDIETRNLGYYSPLQTELTNYFKGLVIEWLKNKKNEKEVNKLIEYMYLKGNSTILDYIIKLGRTSGSTSNCIVELAALSHINDYIIIVVNDINQPLYIFDGGIKYDYTKNLNQDISKYLDKKTRNNKINVRLSYSTNNIIPDIIEVLYY